MTPDLDRLEVMYKSRTASEIADFHWRWRIAEDGPALIAELRRLAALEQAGVTEAGSAKPTKPPQLYVGTMNDALFVIDQPPHPAPNDTGPYDWPNGPNVIAACGTDVALANRLVDAWNAALALTPACAMGAGVTDAGAGLWNEEITGARVATIRAGENGVEMKDNRDGTFDLTVFWPPHDDMTAYRLTVTHLATLHKAIQAVLAERLKPIRAALRPPAGTP